MTAAADDQSRRADWQAALVRGADWPSRPRGAACPTCAALIGYGPAFDADQQLHTAWHARLDHALDVAADAFGGVYTELARHTHPEPKDTP